MNKPSNAMHNTKQCQGFTLVELLIVVALLGALASLMLPTFKVRKKRAYEHIMRGEMKEIQRAFLRFENDCMPNSAELDKMTNVYFALLFDCSVSNHSQTYISFSSYNPEADRGWAGPYAFSEGTRTVTVDAATYTMGAFLDPYGEPYRFFKSNDHYYISAATSEYQTIDLVYPLTCE